MGLGVTSGSGNVSGRVGENGSRRGGVGRGDDVGGVCDGGGKNCSSEDDGVVTVV